MSARMQVTPIGTQLNQVCETDSNYRFMQTEWDLITFDGGWDLRQKPPLSQFNNKE